MSSAVESRARMTRREAIQRVGVLLGGAALVGQSAMLAGCDRTPRSTVAELFTPNDLALLDEIADTILPETSTPGAKAAGVGAFMALMVTDTYERREQQTFIAGMETLDRDCQARYGATFMAADPDQRLQLLEQLDREQWRYRNMRASGAPAHYFRMMKELALLGYFTSEIGYRQAMRYLETPGRYDPCVPYTPGEKSWAPHA
jgi:hypothetical protein